MTDPKYINPYDLGDVAQLTRAREPDYDLVPRGHLARMYNEIKAQRDELLAACIAALALLTGTGQDGTLGHHPDNPVPAMLATAIAKVKQDD